MHLNKAAEIKNPFPKKYCKRIKVSKLAKIMVDMHVNGKCFRNEYANVF